MSCLEIYKGIIPAFYACYDEQGEISRERVRQLAQFFLDAGVQGLYVGGSSGECIYQSVEERKIVLEELLSVVGGKMTVIAHVACNNSRDSARLAEHAESLGVNAIAAIPPIYFRLPEAAIRDYWNRISEAAPKTDFIIYNIPQLAGVALTPALLEEMLKNPRVLGVKNSSMPVQDIQSFRSMGSRNGRAFAVFNGPDEQLLSGLAAGACGGIGGTYGLMPELYLAIYRSFFEGNLALGQKLQDEACELIGLLVKGKGNLYAMIKGALAKQGLNLGSVRAPLPPLGAGDELIIGEICAKLEEVRTKYRL